MLIEKGVKTAEQVVSKTLKDFKVINNSDSLTLSTGGPKLNVNIGKSKAQKQISSTSMFDIKRDLDLSESAIDTILKHIRKDLGRSGVEACTSQSVKAKSHSLSEFYTSEKLEFEETVKVANKKFVKHVHKDLIYVKDPTEFVNHVCDERNINIHDAVVRIGIDGGQGSLKVIINIFDPSDLSTKDKKDSGVNKVLVLAFVEDVQESHYNMDMIFKKTQLNDLKFVLASDFKLLNIITGLSAHGGRHACLYCNGTVNEEGAPRTIGDLSDKYERYRANGSNPKTMKEFDNVIHPCLLEEDRDKLILDIIPIPELHIMMNIVTKLTEILWKNDKLNQLLQAKGVHWHGYNGGGLDGKNANKVLKLLDELSPIIEEDFAEFIPVLAALKKFAQG